MRYEEANAPTNLTGTFGSAYFDGLGASDGSATYIANRSDLHGGAGGCSRAARRESPRYWPPNAPAMIEVAGRWVNAGNGAEVA